MEEKTGVVAFAFGTPAAILSNRQIAQIATQKAKKHNAPVYTQRDVPVELGIELVYVKGKADQPPPTLRLARGAVSWAKERKLTRLFVACAKPHLWRCLRDLHAAAQEARAEIEIVACPEIGQYPVNSWFCADSMQERTRSQKAWEKRERLLRWLPFWLYKFIAS